MRDIKDRRHQNEARQQAAKEDLENLISLEEEKDDRDVGVDQQMEARQSHNEHYGFYQNQDQITERNEYSECQSSSQNQRASAHGYEEQDDCYFQR